jgi:Zn-dependent alcohol dehydrogenase
VLRYERDIPAQVAAVTSCGVITGYGSAVRAAGLRDGDTVVVVGTGGVGMSAVMGAAIAGAAQIVAVDPVAFKREQALRLGATHTAASVDEAGALVSGLTRNRMADAAIITVGVLHGDLIGLTRPLADIDRILALYRAGRLPLDELITRSYKLDDINAGYADMHRGVNLRGVIAF